MELGLEKNQTSTPPKLSLFSLPNQPPEPPGMLTPPLHASVSVPFMWEEAPGKPRPFHTKSKPKSARTLELPPRLLITDPKALNNNNMSSPTTVLDGPYVGRALSSTLSFRIPESWVKRESREKGGGGSFGSRRWGSFRKNKDVGRGSFDFLYPDMQDGICSGGGGGGDGGCNCRGGNVSGDTNVKITRVKRTGSLFRLYNPRSRLLANIYESFKQAVPWRRKQEQMRKMG